MPRPTRSKPAVQESLPNRGFRRPWLLTAAAVLTVASLAIAGLWWLTPCAIVLPEAETPSTEVLDWLALQPTSGTLELEYEITAIYPHAAEAFTQGLLWHAGRLYETTGLYGESTLREVELDSGRVVRSQPIEERYFGEGLALLQGELFWLTWREQTAFVLGLTDFRFRRKFRYDGEGWGLTENGRELIMSDGSNELTFRDPATFEVLRRLPIGSVPGVAEPRLNELEYVRGWVLANMLPTRRVAVIDPLSGAVGAFIDLSELQPGNRPWEEPDVLNGIAWDRDRDRLFVTGKRWARLYQLRLVRPAAVVSRP